MNRKGVEVGFHGAVMGLAGLGLTARNAATVLPGYVRAPAYVTEPWVAIGVIALLVVLFSYGMKLLRDPASVRADFVDPATLGFCGALPVGMTLVAGGLAPYWFAGADVLWWLGCGLLLAFQVWAFYRLLAGGIALEQLNAGWLIVLVGGVVVAGPGVALGHAEASRFFFGASAAAAPVLTAVLLYRAAVGVPLAEALRPTWFILLLPPSFMYANGMTLFPAFVPLETLYYLALVLGAALLLYARAAARWPFGSAWWWFTFPLDALAYAAARYAQDHPTPLWRSVCAATLLLAAFFALLVLWRTLRSVASRPA